MSDWKIPSGPFPEPREGLPPCIKAVVFEERMAISMDRDACRIGHNIPRRFGGGTAILGGLKPMRGHPATAVPHGRTGVTRWDTDDPDEAQAAFERGGEYVRTGEMP